MHAATYAAFKDELEKLGFNIAEEATREGIRMAKLLKQKNVVPKGGNALKDYMHHMDLSAHPKFSQGVKATAQGMTKKVASAWAHAAELGGLGILAAPSVQHLRGKEMSEKNKSRAEVAGLGVLAAPTAIGVAKKGLGMLKKVKKASLKKQAALFGIGAGFRNAAANASHMAIKGMQGGGAKSLAGSAAVGAAKKLAPQAPRAIPTAAQVGGHAFKPATTGKYAPISIPGLT